MKKRYSLYSCALLPVIIIALVGSSCKKYIYDGPITSTYDKVFWTSQSSVEQATLAMYGQLRSNLRNSNSFFINGDLASGSFLPNAAQWNLRSIRASNSPAFNFSYVPYLGALHDWSRFYQLIAQANLILQNVPRMDAGLFSNGSVRNNYLGEALFMRAYAYFYITRIWGDPVFVTSTYNDADYGKIPPLARTPESTVLDSCIADLKSAATYMNFAGGDAAKAIRANKGSVYALLAHIYSWKHQYDSAHYYCQQVIDKGGYSLEPMAGYNNIWKGQNSPESIFELAMKFNASDPNFNNQNSWAEANFGFFGTFLKGPVVENVNSVCWLSPDGGFVNQFFDTAADARYKTIFTHVPASSNDVAGYMLMKYTNFFYQKPDTKTLPYINNNLVLFRLADIILLDAEALAYTGDLPAAAGRLALTEGRAGITSYQNATSQYDMIDEVIAERGRELIGEGQWYYDLIRTQPTQHWLEYAGYPADRVTATNKGYYWPLDMGALFPQDNLLTQNPWWANHR